MFIRLELKTKLAIFLPKLLKLSCLMQGSNYTLIQLSIISLLKTSDARHILRKSSDLVVYHVEPLILKKMMCSRCSRRVKIMTTQEYVSYQSIYSKFFATLSCHDLYSTKNPGLILFFDPATACALHHSFPQWYSWDASGQIPQN